MTNKIILPGQNRNAFIQGTKKVPNTKTENMADAYLSTGSGLLDLFGTIGSLRSRNPQEIYDKFAKAYKENPLLATKMAFYARNIRGGLGERETFKHIIKWLSYQQPETMLKNMFYVPTFGRWDDLYTFVSTPLEDEMWSLIHTQLVIDVNNYNEDKPFSILAKWLKSINTSSKTSRQLGALTAKKLGLTPREYRVVLSLLRHKLDVVERKMSEGNWTRIDFSRVPSLAMTNYHKAFQKRTPETFSEYMTKVKEGKAKINASTLYPYDILEGLHFREAYGRGWDNINFKCDYNEVLEAQWKALPNYVKEGSNVLVMADTSGSMAGRPVCTAVGLAVYFAERNRGEFHNCFLTFSSRPSFIHLPEGSLQKKLQSVPAIVSNTNLEAAFNLVLDVARKERVPAEDMPKAIIVISDGEIDMFSRSKSAWSFFGKMEEKFNNAGYEIPKIVMWNVASRHDAFLDTIQNPKIQFISGQSTSTFKSVLRNLDKSAYELMLDTLNDPMYDVITV